MRFSAIVALFTVASVSTSFMTSGPGEKSGIKTIVIDAGHGGHDPGCQYGGVKEKDITLKIAKKLGGYISGNISGVKVIYTRNSDTFIELHERAAIANRHKADLFISVHCNANNSTRIFGTETYTMGTHKTEENLGVAQRENEVLLLEKDYKAKYEGFDPKSPEAYIIFSLYQDAYMEQSLKLASKIEGQFKNRASRTSRGVKQAGFVVLWKTTMPSVLIETGFLSNAAERKFLNSDNGQSLIASGVYRAVKELKAELEPTKTRN